MNWKQAPLGPAQTNAYVLHNQEGEAVIFDPGGAGEAFEAALKRDNITPLAILLTHAHFDHIGALDHIRDAFNIPVYLHKREESWLADPEKNLSIAMTPEGITSRPADYLLAGEKTLPVGPFTFQLYETPGHSPGSLSYYHEATGTVFSGDVLFQAGIGRTDLPGADEGTLLGSIHHKLLELPENTAVACGHGPTTTIAAEMDTNPFLNGL
ncbi:MBL fold metallo-hydrolase [Natribacillus halophilus]|uniref:Glyoxylase, beta-lactamase superfamily II n=1 Tax=Natribacillus halophilus TaxID=549003 RepID=A0A1G8JM57_9BACI|nr:MBL fold metallo-hydrolase [Natribacillus halophilus]SDI32252.1 Glyoxylase, beta-lactamase superfamily II [Natribacillus halophilus]